MYSSPSIVRIIKSRRMWWAEHVARMGKKRNVYRLFVGKPEGKRPLRRPRRRWMDNIKTDLLVIVLNVVDWIGWAQYRYRWKPFESSGSIKCWELPSGVASRAVLSSTELVS
jgi:hypothetical protein